jgi:predicted hotdog family 3-hydroxylacyl-ACP dehydratase
MLQLGIDYDIADLLPHGPRMRLLDRLVGYDQEWIECELTIRPASRFCDGRGVPAWIGLEYMAQTAAAFAGIERRQRRETPQIGLLLGTRAYEAMRPMFPVGMTLTSRAELLASDGGGVMVHSCTLHGDGELLARSAVKGYQPDDIEPYLQGLEKETKRP